MTTQPEPKPVLTPDQKEKLIREKQIKKIERQTVNK